MCNQEGTNSCMRNLIENILKLQCYTEDDCNDLGCDKPFLGPTPQLVCYNTRPVNFYRCCDGELWTLPFTNGSTTGTSSTFRLENIEGNCVTCRILTAATEPTTVSPYQATDSYFTINLNCIGCMKCLPDVFVPCN